MTTTDGPGAALLAEIAGYVDHATTVSERREDGKARGVCACGWRGIWSACSSVTRVECELHLRSTER